MKKNEISHQGVINSIEGNKIDVIILSHSACSSCESKVMCSISEMKEKHIDIYNFNENKFKIGDNVNVIMSLSMGNKAIFLGYGIPFLLLLSSLLITFNITKNELISGTAVLGVLALYYFVLYAFRNKLNRTFTFRIE